MRSSERCQSRTGGTSSAHQRPTQQSAIRQIIIGRAQSAFRFSTCANTRLRFATTFLVRFRSHRAIGCAHVARSKPDQSPVQPRFAHQTAPCVGFSHPIDRYDSTPAHPIALYDEKSTQWLYAVHCQYTRWPHVTRQTFDGTFAMVLDEIPCSPIDHLTTATSGTELPFLAWRG